MILLYAGDGAATLCTVTLSAALQATCTVSTLARGSHSITAVYSGDATSLTSTSAVLAQGVGGPAEVPEADTALLLGGGLGGLATWVGWQRRRFFARKKSG
jgi:hypothetical protein